MASQQPLGAGAAAAADTRSEKQKMLDGDLYYSFGDELLGERQAAKKLLAQYNATTEIADRAPLLAQLLGSHDPDDPPFIEPPFFCDYGYNIYIGSGSYFNFGCTILDGCRVSIGARVLFGPNVQVYGATHPLDAHVRQGTRGPEIAKPVTVCDDVWVGGAAVLCPGVTIGRASVVGAGSVVTKDVEPYTVVAGNPARVIRRLQPPAGDGAGGAAGGSEQQLLN